MPETIKLQDGEEIDRLGYQGLQIIQNPQKFKFTIDAFLLAGFIQPRPSHTMIDLGTGCGVLPLLIAGQNPISKIYGVEIQPELADMAKRSTTLNNLNEQVEIIAGDLRNISATFKPNSFDYVISNPPFFQVDKGVISENTALACAKFEICCTLDELLKAAVRLVKGNGKLALIYPTIRFAELLTKLQSLHLTPKRLRFIHSNPTSPSHLCLVEAQPGAKNNLHVLPPLFIYNPSGEYSEEMNQIFHGKATY